MSLEDPDQYEDLTGRLYLEMLKATAIELGVMLRRQASANPVVEDVTSSEEARLSSEPFKELFGGVGPEVHVVYRDGKWVAEVDDWEDRASIRFSREYIQMLEDPNTVTERKFEDMTNSAFELFAVVAEHTMKNGMIEKEFARTRNILRGTENIRRSTENSSWGCLKQNVISTVE